MEKKCSLENIMAIRLPPCLARACGPLETSTRQITRSSSRTKAIMRMESRPLMFDLPHTRTRPQNIVRASVVLLNQVLNPSHAALRITEYRHSVEDLEFPAARRAPRPTRLAHAHNVSINTT